MTITYSIDICLHIGSCVDFLDGWLNLVEKLLNTQSIIDSPHTVVSTSTSAATNRQQVTFDAITFVMKAQQVHMHTMCVCACVCARVYVCV